MTLAAPTTLIEREQIIRDAEAKGDHPYTIAFCLLVEKGDDVDALGYSFSVMAPSPENAIIVGTYNAQRLFPKMVDIMVAAVYNGLHEPVQFSVPANDLAVMEVKGKA